MSGASSEAPSRRRSIHVVLFQSRPRPLTGITLILMFSIIVLGAVFQSGLVARANPNHAHDPHLTLGSPFNEPDTLQASQTPLVSWNRAVSCTPVLTTVEGVLGSLYDTNTGVPLYVGGGFKPGVPDKRALSPPCLAGSPPNATFVEIHGVQAGQTSLTVEDCSTSYDAANGGGPYPNNWQSCDQTENLQDPNGPIISGVACPTCMRTIHVGIDRDWNVSGVAPPAVNLNSTSQLIDVQGFVYWNIGHGCCWELHPFTAWRLSGTGADFSVSSTPNSVGPVSVGSTIASTITVQSLNGFLGTISLSQLVSPGTGLTCSLNPASANLGTFFVSTLSCVASSAGSYTVTVTGMNGALSHPTVVTVRVVDFSMATPPGLSFVAGSSGVATISLGSLSNFAGAVTLMASTSPSGLTASLSSANVSLTAGGTATSTLTVYSTPSTAARTYNVIVTATSGSLVHGTTFPVNVTSDFVLSVNPSSTSFAAGSSATTNLGLASLGFSGTVSLSESVSPSASGLTASLSSSSIVLSTGQTVTPILAISSSQSTAPGAYTVTVTGTNGSLVHTVSFKVDIVDFSITTSPTSITINVGSTGTSTITIAAVNGFTGNVGLAMSVTPSGGPACSLSPVSVTVGTSTNAVLACNGLNVGTFLVTVTGTAGSVTHSANVTVNVVDFSIAASPARVSTNAGASATSTITATSLNGFIGAVSLAVAVTPSSGLSCSLSQSSLSLGSSGTALLSCAGSPGTYNATLSATSGSLTHPASIIFTVQDFVLTPAPSSLSTASGGTSNITIASINSFTGTVTLTSSVSPSSGLTCTLSSTSVVLGVSATSSLSCNGSAGVYTVTLTGISGSLSHQATVLFTIQDFTIVASPASVTVLAGTLASSTITVTSLQGLAGTVGFTDSVLPSSSLGCSISPVSATLGSSASSTLSCTGPAGTYTVTVAGSASGLTHTAIVTVKVQDFSLTVVPAGLNVLAGATGTSTVNLASLGDFAGGVSVSTSASPGRGLSCSLSPTTITLGASGTASLSCTGSPGTYSVAVTGVSGVLSHSAIVTFTVQDFTLTAGPTTIAFLSGSDGLSNITVGAVNGFAGNVSLSPTTMPTSGLTCSLNPNSIVLLRSPASSTLSCTGSPGSYTVTVIGTSSGTSHSATVAFAVQDFAMSTNPASMTVNLGTTGNSTVTITSMNGFAGLISLSASLPSGLSCVLTPSIVSLGASATSTLSCTGSPGTYGTTISGSGSGLSHSVSFAFTVQDFAVMASPQSVIAASSATAVSTITVTSTEGFAGTVSLSPLVTPSNGLACSLSSTTLTVSTSATSTLSCNGSPGTYSVTITAVSGSLSHFTTVNFTVQDLAITVTPSNVTIVTSASGTSTLTIASVNGLSGIVSLTSSISPSGLTCTLSPSTLTLGGSSSSTLSCNGSSGTYNVAVTASIGSLSRSALVSFAVQDFTLDASPSVVTVSTGENGSSTITVNGVNGFAGIVALTETVSPSNSLFCTLTQTAVSPSVSATSKLSCAGPPGSYTVTVTGSSGPVSHSVKVAFGVQDFTITSAPALVTINTGDTGASTVSLSAVGGFADSVSLTFAASGPGLACTLSSLTLTLPGTSSLSCNGSQGSYTVTVTGLSRPLSHSTTVAFIVQDFALAVNPTTIAFVQGGSGTADVTITGVNGFTGTVTLTASVSPGSGLTCSLAPTSLTPGPSGTSTLSCSGSLGGYAVTVTGTSARLSHSASVQFIVQDFVLTASAGNVILDAGSTGGTSINAISANGFAGTISLSSSVSASGLSCTLSPASVSLGMSQSSALSCTGSSGSYTVTVTGAYGPLSHSVAVTFTMQDFAVLASPATLTVGSGVTANSTVSIAGVDGFTGTVALTLTVSPSNGLNCSPTAVTVTLGPSASLAISCTGSPGTYKVTVAASDPSGLSHSASVSVTVQDFVISASPSSITVNGANTGTSTVTLSTVNGFAGPVALTRNVSPSGGLTCSLSQTSISLTSSANSILSCSGPPGVYNVTVTGTSLPLSHTATIIFVVQDFATSADPTSVAVNVGGSGTSTILVSALDGFTGTVDLTFSLSPRHGLTCSLTPASITLGISGTSSLSCSGSAGTYSATVTATSGSVAHSVIVSFLVQDISTPDFTITASPTNLITTPGTAASSSISISSVNGFSGNISLTQSVSPTTGLTCSLNPANLNLTSSASSTLSCNGSPGIYTVSVTGSNGTLAHTISVAFSVQDFTLDASPSDIVSNAGSAAVSTITVASQGEFTGTVALVASTSPSNGVACSFSASGVMLGNSGTSTILCQGTAGTYTVTVTGSSGSLSHSVTVTLRILDFAISLDQTSVTILSGTTSTATLTLNSLNSFSGTVSLAEAVSPVPGLLCSLSQNTVSLAGSASLTLSCSSSSAGEFTASVTGINGPLSHTANISFTVQDFALTPSGPVGLTCNAGDSCTAPVVLVPLNGFTGPVTFSASVSPGLTATLSPTSLAGTGSSTLTVSAGSPANYTVVVTGTFGSLSRSSGVITINVVDFTVTTSSETVTSTGGKAVAIDITVTPSNRFASTVTLSESLSPATGLACSLNPNNIYASGTLLLSCNGLARVYSLTVTGSSGSLSHSITVSLTIQDYSLTVANNTITVTAGTLGSSSIQVSSINGFTGVVALSASVSPSTGLACSIAPGTVTLGTSPTSALSCSGFAGNYTVTVTGNSMGLVRASVISFTVTDFALTASPRSATVSAGGQATSVVTVSGLAGFTGTVSLSSASSSPGIACSLSASSIPLGSSGTSTLSCSGSSGSYAVTIMATSGALTHEVTLGFTFQDFSLFVTSSSLTTTSGSTGSLPISLLSLQGFTGTVSLAATPQSGLACALAPNSVALGSSAASTLSCSGSSGTYSVTVTSTSGSLSHSTTVIFTVQDLFLTASPKSETLSPGVTGTSTITISSVNGFTGIVLLTDSISPSTGLSCQLGPTRLTLSGSASSTLACGGSPGTYSMTVTGSSGSLSRSTTITFIVQDFTITANPGSVIVVSATPATSTISLTSQGGFSGVLSLSAIVNPSVGLTCSLAPSGISLGTTGVSTLSCSGSPGTYIVSVVAASTLISHSASVTFTIQDFSLATSGSVISLDAGTTGVSTVTASPVNAFSGTVTLSLSISPFSGLTCTLTPSKVTLGSAAMSTLSCSGSAGTYTVTVTGASSGLSHVTTVTYTVQDFNLSISPTSSAALAGATGNSTITVTALNGLKTMVSLSSSISPATGLTCSLNSISISVPPSPASSIISCTGNPGSYTVTVTGTDNILSHSTTLTFSVQDFNLSGSPTNVAGKAGTSGTSTITVSPVNGLAGSVSLRTTASPAAGLTCTLSVSTVTLGQPGTSNLSCNGTAGVYTVTVLGSTGSLSHSTTIIFTVQDFSVTASPSSITLTAGAAGTPALTVASVDGFAGTLSLALSVSPMSGLICTLTPGTLTLGASASSTLSCGGSAGSYTVIITASSGTLAHSTSVGFSVQDFTVTASPTTVTIPAGSAGSSTVTVTGLGGFAGSLSFSPLKSPLGLGCSLSPSTVSLVVQTASILSCTGSAGTYSVDATVSTTGLSHTVSVTFRVQDFSTSVTPTVVAVSAGATGTSTLTATSLNRFNGTVGLSQAPSPLGLACTLSPTSMTLSSSAASTLSCHGSGGTYIVTVLAASGSLSHSVLVTFTVSDFTISSSLIPSFTAGSSGTAKISVNSLGFNGTISLAVTTDSSSRCGIPVVTTTDLVVGGGTLASGGFTPGIPDKRSTAPPCSVNGSSMYIRILDVTLTNIANGAASGDCNPINGVTYCDSTADAVSFGSTQTLHIEIDQAWKAAGIAPPDFPTDGSRIDITGFAYWDGQHGCCWEMHPVSAWTITARSSSSPPSTTALAGSLNPASVALTQGATGSSVLIISTTTATPGGQYNLTVIGTSGSIVHTVTVTFTILNDFTVSSRVTSVSLPAGSSGTLPVSLKSLGFSGTLTLAASVSGGGATASPSQASITLTPGAGLNSTLTISSSTAGTYAVTVTGTAGGLSHSTVITLRVVDFTMSVGPTSLTLEAGYSGSSTASLAGLNGFSGTVFISVSVASSGPAVSAIPPAITFVSGGTATSTIIVVTSSTTIPGNYAISITGISGGLSHSVSLSITVRGFNIAITPSQLTIPVGSSASAVIQLTSLNGFSGTVTLSAYSIPSGLAVSLGSTSTSLSSGASGSSTITVSVPGSLPSGDYFVIVNSTSGQEVHQASIIIFVVDFSFSASPSTLTTPAGNSASSILKVISLNGFAGNVSLSGSVSPVVINGPTTTFSPSIVAVLAARSASSTLALSTTRFTPAGTYNITVTGRSGTLARSVSVIMVVTGNFAISANPISLGVPAGSSGTTTIALNSTGFSGTVSLSASSSPSGPTFSFSPGLLPLSFGGSGTSTLKVTTLASTASGKYNITVTGTSGTLAHSTFLTLTIQANFTLSLSSPTLSSFNAGGSASAMVFLNSTGFTGVVSLGVRVSALGPTVSVNPLSVSLTPGVLAVSTLSFATTTATQSGSYTVTLTGTSGSMIRQSILTITVTGNFTITTSSTIITIQAGAVGSSQILLSSAGLAGTLSLNVTRPSSSLATSINPAIVSLVAGGSASSNLTVTTVPSTLAGSYLVKVTGTSGSLSHSITVSIKVTADFTISAVPTGPGRFVASGSTTSTVTVSSFGLLGNVSLSASVSPPRPGGPTPSFSPSSLQLTAGSVAVSTMTVSTTAATPPGNYTIIITGVGAGLLHSANFNVTVQADFTLTATPGTIIVPAGSAVSSIITLGSFGLSGPVALSATVVPTGPSFSFSSTTVQLALGGTGVSTLTFSTAHVSNYTVTVTASSGPLSHTTTIVLRVVDFEIALNPEVVIVTAGSSGFSTATLTSLNGFSGIVTLTSVQSSSTPTCSLNPVSVVLGSSAPSTLTCSGFITGFSVNLTGSSGPLSHSATVTFVAQDFTIAASPTGITVNAEADGTSNITATGINGYAGTVSLSSSVSPAGLTCRLGTPNIILGTSATSGLSCNGSAGTYTVSVTGSSGSLAHSVLVTVKVQDFSITAGPASVSIVAGVTGSTTLIIYSINDLTGTVSLAFSISPATGLTCNLNPTSLGLESPTNSTLLCSGFAGVYTVIVTASAGSLVHYAAVPFTVKDFTITATPQSLTVSAGGAGTSTISIAGLNGFTENVTLSFGISPSGGLNCNLTLSRLTVGTSSSSVLSCNGSSGTYTVSVDGVAGTLSHSVTVVFIVQDFTVSAAPPSMTINALNTGTATVNVYALNGFSGNVTLLTVASPGLTAALATSTIIASGSSTLTVTAGSPGVYTATVTATSGSLIHSVAVSITVADFTVSASPLSLRFDAGASAASTITIASVNGFNSSINLSASPSSGLTASISQPITTGSGSTTLTVTAPTAGTYEVTVTATSGRISHTTATITVTVVDFNIASSLSTVGPVNAGSSGTATITVFPLDGFGDTVALSVNSTAGLTATLSPVTLAGSGSSTLTVTAASAGSYSVTVTGTSRPLAHTVLVSVNVVDFTISANPLSLRLSAGAIGTSTIIISPVNGFAGKVDLSASGSPGLDTTLSTTSIVGSGASVLTLRGASEGTYNVTVTAKIGSLSHSTPLITVAVVDFTVTASPSSIVLDAGEGGTAKLTVTGLNGFNGTVALEIVSSPGLDASLAPASVTSSGTSILSVSAVAAGTYNVTVTGSSGSLSHQTVTVTVTVIDFAIMGSPSTITVDSGQLGAFTFTISPANGFARTVLLSAAASNGLTAGITPASVTPPGTATLTVSATAAGTYTVTVTGASGSLTHTADVTINVVDFTMTASPTSLSLFANSLGTSTITISGVNGFSGTVTLSITASPGILGILSVQRIVGSGTSTVTVNATTAGTYNITVAGVSGPLSHTTPTITVTIVDFTISASPTNLTIDAGASGMSTLTIGPLNGFSGTVSLSFSSSQSLNVALSPEAVTGSGVSTVTVSGVAAGTYSVIITGSSGSLSHRTGTIIVNIVDFALTVTPTSFILDSGTPGASSVTVSALNGFSGEVSFSVNASQGLTFNVSPASITGSGTSAVTVSATAAGTYTLTVTGTSGPLVHTTGLITVHVVDFTISSSPGSLTLDAGTPGTFTITVTGQNGFPGTVSLTETNSSGLTATLSRVLITASGSSTLTVSAPAPGTYTVAVTGTSGSLAHSVTVTVNVVDFNLSANPSSATINNGDSTTSIITVASLNVFSGTVLLTSHSSLGVAASLASPSVAGAGASILTLNATSPGTYTVTVTGTSGPLSHSVALTIRVVDFTVSASQPSLVLYAGTSTSITVTVGPVNGFTGTVVLSATPSNGLAATLSTATLIVPGTSTLTLSALMIGNYTVTVHASSGSLYHATGPVNVRVVDFALVSSPQTGTLDAGATGTANVAIISLNGFSGNVTLTAFSSAGLTTNLSPASVTGSGGVTVTVTAPSAGTYAATVTGTGGSLTHSVAITVQVVDFAIASSPSTMVFYVGSSSSSTITITSLNGFSGLVTLGATPSSGAINVLLSPSRLGGSGTSMLTVDGSVEGTFSVTVTGTGGSLTHSTVVVVIVSLRPDLTVSASPTTVGPLDAGASGTSTITVVPVNGFTGIVSMAISGSQGVTASISPTSITLGTAGSSTLTVGSSVAGTYTVTAIATNGSLTRSVTVTVSVVDFAITANPSTLILDAGSSGNSTITISELNGFARAVALAASSSDGLSVALASSSIVGSGSANLVISAISEGTYNVTVTGSSGSISHSVVVLVRVVDFLVTANPGKLQVDLGASSTSTITVSAVNGFTGTVTLSQTTSPGLTATLSGVSLTNSGTVSLTVTPMESGNFTVSLTAVSEHLTHSIHIKVGAVDFRLSSDSDLITVNVGSSANSTIQATGINGFAGNLSLTTSISPLGPRLFLSPSVVLVDQASQAFSILTLKTGPSAVGNYSVIITASDGVVSRSLRVTFNLVDFQITSSPSALLIPMGSGNNSAVGLLSLNGFSGNIDLTATSAGPLAYLAPTSITLLPGGARTAVLTVESGNAEPGAYKVTLTGRTGSLTHSVTVDVRLVDFSIENLPVQVSVHVGSSALSTVTLTSLGGFAGSLNLTLTSSNTGVKGALNNSSLILAAGGRASTALSISVANKAAVGMYKITVRAFSGSISKSLYVSVSVTDFVVYASGSSLTLSRGSSTNLTITLAGLGGFEGTVRLGASASPSGPNVSLTRSTASVPAGGSIVVTLAVSAPASIPLGDYNITVTAVDEALSHPATIILTITPAPVVRAPGPVATGPPDRGLNLALQLILAGNALAAVIALVAAVSLARRKSRRQP